MRILLVLALSALALECERVDFVMQKSPPPKTFAGLRNLPGPPPSGTCAFPSVTLSVDSLKPIVLGDSATLRFPPGWQMSPPRRGDDKYTDTRLALPGDNRVQIQRERDGRGRSYMKYASGVDAQGTTCSLDRGQTGAIWSLYLPDPQDTTRALKYVAFGSVMTPAGLWYRVFLSTTSAADQSRLASILTEAMLLPQR